MADTADRNSIHLAGEYLMVAEWRVKFGGEKHTGWLPHGAAVPPPTPTVRADLAFAIVSGGDEGGFNLEWRGPSPETSNDTWHESVEAAIDEAEEKFGVPRDAWVRAGAAGERSDR